MTDDSYIHQEGFRVLCHEVIGRGMSREVYDSKVLPGFVVKTEQTAGCFQNIIEWETWQRVKDTPMRIWFAPCEWISPTGAVLVMRRTERPTLKQFPKKLPVCFTDTKRTNYGLYEGRVVCHDYGTSLIFEHGMSKRMRNVNWWDE